RDHGPLDPSFVLFLRLAFTGTGCLPPRPYPLRVPTLLALKSRLSRRAFCLVSTILGILRFLPDLGLNPLDSSFDLVHERSQMLHGYHSVLFSAGRIAESLLRNRQRS